MYINQHRWTKLTCFLFVVSESIAGASALATVCLVKDWHELPVSGYWSTVTLFGRYGLDADTFPWVSAVDEFWWILASTFGFYLLITIGSLHGCWAIILGRPPWGQLYAAQYGLTNIQSRDGSRIMGWNTTVSWLGAAIWIMEAKMDRCASS
jgi:hypothetical protein